MMVSAPVLGVMFLVLSLSGGTRDAKRAALLPRIATLAFVVLDGLNRRPHDRWARVQRTLDMVGVAENTASTAQACACPLIPIWIEQACQRLALIEIADVR